MDRCGDPGLGSCLYHGETGVAAGTDHHIGPEFSQDRTGLAGGTHQITDRNQVMFDLLRFEGTVKTGDMHGTEGIARLRHQILFQPPLRAHKQELRFRILRGDALGQGDGGIDMARRAAAGKDHPVQF